MPLIYVSQFEKAMKCFNDKRKIKEYQCPICNCVDTNTCLNNWLKYNEKYIEKGDEKEK